MNTKYPPLNMRLRNGKVKLQFPKCRDCNEFYAHKKYKYKCSGCYKGLKNVTPWRDEDFRNRVNEWAEEKHKKCIKPAIRPILIWSSYIISNQWFFNF